MLIMLMVGALQIGSPSGAQAVQPIPPGGFDIPIVDLQDSEGVHVVVDREKGQYLGHPTTVLLEDGKTILCVYPKGHGKGGVVYKRSTDGGKTWSERLPTPKSWASSREVPTIHRVVDAQGTKRLIMWSGLYPARLAVSEDDGASWSELEPAGDWGGIVVMGCVVKLKKPGRYMAMFHDDGRFFTAGGKQREARCFYALQDVFRRRRADVVQARNRLVWHRSPPLRAGRCAQPGWRADRGTAA